MKKLKDKYNKWIWNIVRKYFFDENYRDNEEQTNKSMNQIMIQRIEEKEISKKEVNEMKIGIYILNMEKKS